MVSHYFRKALEILFGCETKRQKYVKDTVRELIEYGSLDDIPLLLTLGQEYRECLDRWDELSGYSPFYRAMCKVTTPVEFALNIWRLGVDVRSWTGEGEHIFGTVTAPEFIPILKECLRLRASVNSKRRDDISLLEDASGNYNHMAIEIICAQKDFDNQNWLSCLDRWRIGAISYPDQIEKVKKYRPHLLQPLAMEKTLKALVDNGMEIGKLDLSGWNFKDDKEAILFKYGYNNG